MKSKIAVGVSMALTGSLLMGGMSVAHAQADGEKASSLEEVIVTGRPIGGAQITQLESSVSITTFDEDRLRESGASSGAALVAQVPGVWAEPSGGEAGNNVFVRGIPATGQYLYSKISVDGLPIFEASPGFAPLDGLLKVDETIARLEVVRGGTSSIFASNSPGGVFNYIHKKGTQEREGLVKFSLGDYGYQRGDVFLAGPVNDDWTYALGGFYRTSDGVRDPGFTADKGGQFRIALTRELEKGNFTVSAHQVKDRNIFYLPFPLADVGQGDPAALPGQDANYDTNVSAAARFTTFVRPVAGDIDADIADGIFVDSTDFGTEFNWEFDNGWSLSNKNRYTDLQSTLNTHIIIGLIGGSDNGYQEFLDNQLSSLQALNPAITNVEAVLNDGTPYTGILAGRDQRIIGQGSFFYWDTIASGFINDLQLAKSFETSAGTHNITAGLYLSNYKFERDEQINGFLQEVKGSPRVVDINGVDANGNVLATGTVNGYNNLGLQFFGFTSDNEVKAFYLSDEWEVNDKLRIDLGVRFEEQDFEGNVFTPTTFTEVLGPRAIPTLADDQILSRGTQSTTFNASQSETAFSIGGNYVLSDALSVYARYTDSYRTPTVEDLARVAEGLHNTGAANQAVSMVPVNEIVQFEGGFKYAGDNVDAFITFFQSEFDNATSNDPTGSPDGSIVNLSADLSSSTSGVEAEIEVGPFAGFSANLKTTIQTPEIDQYIVAGASPAEAAAAASVVGNRPGRIPKLMVNFRPKYEFDIGEKSGSVFLNIFHTDERFEDVGNQISLPPYTTIGFGATLDLPNGLEFTLIGNNLTNEVALTEGNPRDLGSIMFGSSATSNFGRPILGRHFRFSMGYRF